MNHSLYLLSQEYISELIANNGEITPRLSELTTLIISSADNYVHTVEQLRIQIAYLEERIKDIVKLQDMYAREDKRLTEQVKTTMFTLNTQEIKGDIYRLNLSKSIPALEIIDESSIPKEFKFISEFVDKSAVKNALKDGLDVPGARLNQGYTLKRYVNKGGNL